MSISKSLFGLLIASGLLFWGCKEEVVKPLPNNGSATPPVVTDLKVMNLHGEAKILYTVPADPNILYVEAEWTSNGVKRNTKASYYSDTLDLQGFGDTAEHQVQVYSVTSGEAKSASVSVTVKPLISPVQLVYKTLAVKPDFGGINVQALNVYGANIVIPVITNDSTGTLAQADAYYGNQDTANFSVRGFDSSARKFGVYVKDRWGNTSDTLYTTVTPYFEKQLNKSLFKEYTPYPGDVNSNIYSGSYPLKNIWDGSTGTIYVTKTGLGMPESFTIDLGVTATLSRMSYYQRQSTAFYFTSATPEVWDIYGSNNPSPDGSYDAGWTLLMHCQSKKPSGLPLGTTSTADITQAQNGEGFSFPAGVGGYRYIRINMTKTYGNAANLTFSEMTFWGAF